MVDELRLRALDNLLQAERAFREQAEARLRALTAILTELAYRVDGERLEELRRQDASVPNRWGASEWREFFQSASLSSSYTSSWGGAAWSAGEKKNGNHKEVEKLQAEIERLKQELFQARMQLSKVRQEQLITSVENPKDSSLEPQTSTPSQSVQNDKSTSSSRPENYAYAHFSLAEWKQPAIPTLFADRLKSQASTRRDAAVNERRRLMFIWLLAVSGVSTQIEISRLIASKEGISPEAGSIKRPIESLTKENLVVQKTLSITVGNVPTHLVVFRLSEDGRQLCRLLQYEIVENDWERMVRLHEGDKQEGHTLAVLLFAAHARLRGWKASVLPEINNGSPARPDLLIENQDGERWFVEVETQPRMHENNAKWRNLAELQDGKIAVCACTVEDRKTIIQDCAQFHGVATDLETLIAYKLKNIKIGDPLWSETW